MKKILIVLNDVVLLSILKRQQIRFPKEFKVFFAKNIDKSFEIIESESIDLLITELDLSDINNIEFILDISAHNPLLKISFFVLENHRQLKNLPSIHFIQRPNKLEDVIRFIRDIADIELQALTLKDNILKLIEYQKKTCVLAIENRLTGQSGLIYFDQGILYNATLENISEESAVLEMLKWKQATFRFENARQNKLPRKIFANIDDLINGKKSLAIRADNALTTTEAKAKAEQEAKAKAEQEAKVKAEQEAKVKAEQEAKAKAEQEAKAKAEQEAKAKAEQEAKAKAEQEAKAKAEQEAKAKAEQEAKAMIARFNNIKLDEMLKPLQDMNHYLASGIFCITGDIIVKHHIPTFNDKDIISLTKISLESLNNMKTKSDFVQINCENYIFQTIFELNNKFSIVVLLKPEAQNMGLSKKNLDKICKTICNQLLE